MSLVGGLELEVSANIARLTKDLGDVKRQVSDMAGAFSGQMSLVDQAAMRAAVRMREMSGASTAQVAAMKAAGDQMGKTAMSAAAMSNAMRGIPAQFTDIFTSLAAGQPPMQVMLQQGGQLKDMFGGIGPAAKALGGYIVGLVNPYTVAAAAVGVLGYAFVKGAAEVKEMNRAIELTSGFAGLTRSAMLEMAKDVSASTTLTIGASKELITGLVASGQIGAQAIGSIAKVASDLAKATGKDMEKIGPDMVKLFADPAKGAEDLNKQMHFLSVSDLERIAHLQRIGDLSGAQLLLSEKLTGHIPKQITNLGYLEKTWDMVTKAASSTWDAMLGVGREQTLDEKLKALKARLEEVSNVPANQFLGGSPADQARVDRAQTKQRAADQARVADEIRIVELMKQEEAIATGNNGIRAEGQRAALQAEEVIKTSLTYQQKLLVDKMKLVKDSGEAGVNKERTMYELGRQQFELARSMAADQRAAFSMRIESSEKLKAIGNATQVEQLDTEYKLGLISQAGYDLRKASLAVAANMLEQDKTRALLSDKLLLPNERLALNLTLERLKADEKLIKLKGDNDYLVNQNKFYADNLKQVEAIGEKEIEALTKSVAAQKQHNAEIGKTAEQKELEKAKIEAVTIAQLEFNAAALQTAIEVADVDTRFVEAYQKRLDAINAEIGLRKNLVTLQKEGAAAEAAADLAKKSEAEWKKVVDGLEKQFHDGFNKIFEKGVGGWKAMVDTFKSLFKNTVIDYIYQQLAKPFILNVIASVAGVAGASGLANAATNAAGVAAGASSPMGVGGWLSAGSTLKSIYDAVTGAPAAAYNAFATSGLGSSLGLSAPAATALAEGPMISNAITSLGQTVGTALSYVGAGLAGIAIGQTIAGDKIVLGVSGTVTSTIGSVLGGILGGPLGAVIGGGLGGLVNRAFGSGPKEYGGTNLVGNLTAGGFQGNYQTNWSKSGGWFSSGSSGTDYNPVGNDQLDAFRLVVQGFGATFQKLADISGAAGRNFSTYVGYVNRELNTQEQMNTFIQDIAFSIGTWVVTGLEKFQKAGENLADTAVRLTDEFIVTNNIAMLLGKNLTNAFGAIGLESLTMRDQLVQMMGGMTNASNVMQSYYQNFFTDSERHANDVKALQAQFAAIGQTMPETRAGFRALVESVSDLGTTAGQQTFVALMNLQQAFAAVVPVAQDVATALTGPASPLGQFMTDIQKQYQAITAMPVSAFEQSLSDLITAHDATIAKAKELGASENQLTVVRLLNTAETNKLVDAENERLATEKAARSAALADQMKGVDYALATAGMDALAKSIYDVHKAADEATAKASATNAGFAETSAALLKIRQLETVQVDALTAAEAARVQGLKDSERQGLQDQLDSLTMTSTELLNKQRDALYADNVALFDNIQAIKDKQAADAEEQRKRDEGNALSAAINAKVIDQQVQYFNLLGDAATATAIARRRELDAMDESLRPMQEQIYLLQDKAEAETKATAAAAARAAETAKQDAQAEALASQMKGIDYQNLTLGLSAYKKTLLDINIAQAQAMEQARANGAAETGAEILRIQMLGDAQRKAAKDSEALRIATEAAAAASAIERQQVTLDVQVMELLGQTSQALTVKRNLELEAMDASLRPTQQLIYALTDQAAATAKATQAAEEAAAKAREIATERQQLQDQLDSLTMTSAQLLTKQRDALNESNRALFDQINAAKDAAQAVQDQAKAEQEAATLQTQRSGLSVQWLNLAGYAETALMVQRAIALKALDESLHPIQKQIWAMEDTAAAAKTAAQAEADLATETQKAADAAKALASQRAGMEIALMEAQGNAAGALAAKRALELAALDATLQPLQSMIYAAQDAAAAANEAAKAQADLAAKEAQAAQQAQALAQARSSIEGRILQAQGDAAGYLAKQRADELAAADASLHPMLQTLYGIEDASAAAALAAKAQSEAEAAATAATKAQADALKAMRDEADKARASLDNMALSIRATIASILGTDGNSAQSRAMAKMQINGSIATLQAGGAAPDEAMLKSALSTLAKADISAYATRQAYQRDLQSTANMLDTLASLVEGKSASIPHYAAGGDHPGGWAMVGEQGPELINMPAGRVFNATDTASMLDNGEVVAELRALRAQVSTLIQSSNVTAISTKKTADTVVRVTRDGESMLTEAA